MKAVLTGCSVDPALPDLLTRRGPLGHPVTKTDPRRSQGKVLTVIGSVSAVEGQKSPHVLHSVSLPHVAGYGGQLSCGIFRTEPATRWFDGSLATLRGSNEQFAR